MFGLIETLIYVMIGLFIGWSIPQPQWAKTLMGWMRQKVRNAFERLKSE